MTSETLSSSIIALAAVPLFYLIYFRHFFNYYRQKKETPEYAKHLEAFLYGVTVALLLVLGAPLLQKILSGSSVIFSAFVRAALLEKAGLLLMFLAALRYYPRFTALEGIVSGIAMGTGFSLVENIIYAVNFGPAVIIPRLLFSAPLHLTTCGMMGYYLSAMSMSASKPGRYVRALLALALPVAFHGAFDALLFNQGARLFLAGPLVIILVGGLELIISRSKLIPSVRSLTKTGLRLEDWFLKYRQPRFERWIQNSMGTPADIKVPLFRAHSSKKLWVVALFLFILSVIGLPFSREISAAMGLNLGKNISILLTSVYPASMAASLAMVGIINPDFFRYNIVRLPIIFDAVLRFPDREENIISFDITPSNCFLRSFEPLGNDIFDMRFEIREFHSGTVKSKVIWENHGQDGDDEPTGSIVTIENPSTAYYFFILRYYLFRIWKGIVFNLKLPGFESIRRLFMSPATIMQKEIVYHPGSTIFRQGESINTFYFIKKGEVQIIKELDSGEEIILETMEKGQIFNEMALLGDTQRTVTARCLGRCVLAEARADNLEALIKNDPDFALALVLKLLNRVDSTQNSLTQTIEYLQSLLQIKEKGAYRAALLMALLLGHKASNGTLSVPLSDDRSAINKIEKSDMVIYLQRMLRQEKTPPGDSAKTKAIEKMLDGLILKINGAD